MTVKKTLQTLQASHLDNDDQWYWKPLKGRDKAFLREYEDKIS